MQNKFENALAWFAAAPSRWVQSAKKDLTVAAEWVWVVLQGDFTEEASTAQTITGTVISMIPVVDQICDVRDVVANCKKIHEDSNNTWHWVALVLTLIGLFPTLGSLAKGCFKILFAYGRKAAFKATTPVAEGLWKFSKPWVESGIQKLNQFLARPEVRKTLAALRWDNPFKELARLMRELTGKISTTSLLRAMDEAINALKKLLNLIQKWGTAAMSTKAGELLEKIMHVRKEANTGLGEVLKPVQDWLDHLARRLEVEADTQYRAYLKAINSHNLVKPTLDAEVAQFKKAKPAWVDKTKKIEHQPARKAPIKNEWPDLSDTAKGHTKGGYKTFEKDTIKDVTIPPGETLYRVLDPASKDNSICWMRKAEFDKLKSKDDWRRTFAVWTNWNSNGEFVTYTVPPGKGLNVWEGAVGTQTHKIDKAYKLEGGATQIVLDPEHLDKRYIGKRQKTNWDYTNADFAETTDMVGVPTLTHNWPESK